MKLRQSLGFLLAAWGASHGAASVTKTYLATPLAFESNPGQSGTEVQYVSRGGGYDAFLTKFDSTGKVIFSTFLGGNNDEQSLFGVKLDSSGNVYIAGASKSGNYPTTTGACHTTNKGGWGAVVTKIEFEQVAAGPSFTATGEGKTDTPISGRVTPSGDPFTRPLLAGWTATVGGIPSPNIWFAGSAPGSVAGVFQVNLEIPSGLSPGNQELIIKAGNFSSQAGLTVAVK